MKRSVCARRKLIVLATTLLAAAGCVERFSSTESSPNGTLTFNVTISNATGAATLANVECTIDGERAETFFPKDGPTLSEYRVMGSRRGSPHAEHRVEIRVFQRDSSTATYRFSSVSAEWSSGPWTHEYMRTSLDDRLDELSDGSSVSWSFWL